LPNGKVRPQVDLDEYKGTKVYMSVDGLSFKTQGRSDDFKALAYTLISLKSDTYFSLKEKKDFTPA
jgi:hypothetical protein